LTIQYSRTPCLEYRLSCDLAIAPLVLGTRGQELHDEVRRGVEFAIVAQDRVEPRGANPYHIGRHGGVVGKDDAWRVDNQAGPRLPVPRLQRVDDIGCRRLMMPVWLCRHEEFSIDELITLIVQRHGKAFEIADGHA